LAATYREEGFALVKRDRVALHLKAPLDTEPVAACWIPVRNIEALYQTFLSTSALSASPLTAQPCGFMGCCSRDPSRRCGHC
jgi:hypothetical protein